METQLKRGFLDICVLAALSREDSYGYQIIKDVPSTLELSESTLYPILKRLKAQGMLEEYTREHNGRLRKYYTITDKGQAALQDFVQEEAGITKILAYIREGAES
ncbi:PadR family transcriptional regulator [Olsenella sp. Marseille-P4559]|uniref:PadR family transcriptional regulator n=1 Tax=Olsenella sp. Marseille-P4559 TaxID=2364795 RepID=UPI00103239A6|nr:PadR family transcriptional regulator [Olsenella sp. Marseille-P4559]